jgi:predicted RNase H-like HicB family nuclease
MMTRHYPIVIETEDNGDVSAYVAGLPIYAQAATEAQAVKDIRAMLGAFFKEHVLIADATPTPASIAVARVDTNRPGDVVDIAIVGVAALVGSMSSSRKAISSRANGRLGGRPKRAAER